MKNRIGWNRLRNSAQLPPMSRVWLLTVFALLAVSGEASGGVVRIQTADPSCPDDSGNIYVDCGNGTVTDNRTGLVWLADADCLGGVDWSTAMEFAAGLSDNPQPNTTGDCGLSDGSSAGEWRLPSVAEWEAMVADALGEGGDPDCTAAPPTITNDTGFGCWVSGPSSFFDVESDSYWSSTTSVVTPLNGRSVFLSLGLIGLAPKTVNTLRAWPVRGGQ